MLPTMQTVPNYKTFCFCTVGGDAGGVRVLHGVPDRGPGAHLPHLQPGDGPHLAPRLPQPQVPLLLRLAAGGGDPLQSIRGRRRGLWHG